MAILSADRFWSELSASGCWLADGAIGTELMARGASPEDVLEANLCSPGSVQSIHEAYIAAGARMITSNTFGPRTGRGWSAEFRAGVEIALACAADSRHDVGVWVSVPAFVVPREQEMLRRLLASLPAWPGMLLIETCTDLETTLSAAGAAARLEPTLLAVTAHFGADCKMADGTTPEQFAASLEQVGAHIVGANCGHTPEQFVEITARMRQAATTPLLIQPSAGLPEPDAAGTGRYSVGPDRFAEVAARLLDAGADVVGGCCGTTPAYIAAVSERAISPRVRKPTA